MDRKLTKRQFFNFCGIAGAVYVGSRVPEFFPLGPEVRLDVVIKGRRARLKQLPESSLPVVHAQYAYYQYQYHNPYTYYGAYQMWAQWNYARYQAYMYQLAQQRAWMQSYMSPLGMHLQRFASSHSLSEPFPMDSVRSVYSYGDSYNPQAPDVVAGLNRVRQPVTVTGRAVSLMSAVSSIGKDEDWVDVEIEATAGPQRDSGYGTERINNRILPTDGYRTINGTAFVTKASFKDEDSGEQGNLVVFDTKKGRELRLVEV
ncbi:MAG: hypothetical protein QM757_06780 [Paludibaculum sp.]